MEEKEVTVNSEIPDSSQSIPSEPPDIRNWFPSYEYESFVLDTSHGFGDCEETQHNLLLTKTSLHSDDSTKVSDTSCTPTDLSEPPDIRNWFSSYVYDSPNLSQNHNLEGILSDEKATKIDDFAISGRCTEQQGKSEAFKDTKISYEVDICEKPCKIRSTECNSLFVDTKHKDQSPKKIFDSIHSPSQLSEPPAIRNWFPSYKYESPIFIKDDFGELSSDDSECEEVEVVIEESENEEGDGLGVIRKVSYRGGKKILSKNLVEHNCSLGDEKLQVINKDISKENGNLSDQNIPPIKIFDHGIVEDTMQGQGISLANNNEESSLNNDGSLCNQQEALVEKADSYSANMNTCSDRSSRGFSQVRVAQTKKPNNDQENEGKLTSEDGFISTRNRQRTISQNENSLRPWKILSECSIKRNAVSSGEKRKALSERTNLHHSDELAATGKWKCPQKLKPNVGPRLKQLRLDKFVYKL
ncbi:hypothetical protein ACFE04_028387 [Oxalis oulophora]